MADAAAAKDAAGRDAAELWAFSLEFYARPGIAETCLRLQDAHGLDVNLLLLCCWLGSSGRGRLSEADLAAAEARAAQWRQAVIVPLRAIRRALKPMNAALYEAVKRVELDAEREEQSLLLARGLGA